MAQGQERESRASRDNLKAREYRDANGQIHHHTAAYMRDHAADRGKASAGKRGGRSSDDRSSGKSSGGGARTATDHDEIRTWAEAHGGKPAAVERTHRDGDVGIIRIMFPNAPNSEHAALTEISWDEFFDEFEGRKLALLYEPDSLFSKIIGRDTAEKRAHGDNKAAR